MKTLEMKNHAEHFYSARINKYEKREKEKKFFSSRGIHENIDS